MTKKYWVKFVGKNPTLWSVMNSLDLLIQIKGMVIREPELILDCIILEKE